MLTKEYFERRGILMNYLRIEFRKCTPLNVQLYYHINDGNITYLLHLYYNCNEIQGIN